MINMAIGMSEYMFRTQKGAEFILSNIYSSRDILLLLKSYPPWLTFKTYNYLFK
jgi:hypothetical protein